MANQVNVIASATITTDTDTELSGMNPGDLYTIKVVYQSGTGTLTFATYLADGTSKSPFVGWDAAAGELKAIDMTATAYGQLTFEATGEVLVITSASTAAADIDVELVLAARR